MPACYYYDGVTAGILAEIRRDHDKIAYDFSAKTITAHADDFMFWGAKHSDYGYVENKRARATVCWLGQLLLGYEAPVTRFTQILNCKGENLTLFPIKQTGETTPYNVGINLKAIVLPGKAEEILLEPSYIVSDYLMLHVFAPIRRQDKVRRNGIDYEVLSVQGFTFKNQIVFLKLNCRRLLSR